MALTPYLSPLTFPAGTEIPGTMQGLANLLPQPRLPLRLSADEIGHPPPASERVQHHDLVEQ